jgi:LDH2 family malate/lactate/ureidoglycolate dehydrogenase
VQSYKESVDLLIEAQKSLPKAEGVAEIFVPGEPEHRIEEQRKKNGIPLPAGTINNLRAVARRFGVKMPDDT